MDVKSTKEKTENFDNLIAIESDQNICCTRKNFQHPIEKLNCF